MGRTLGLLVALALGACVPQLAPWSFLIRWILFVLLFWAFLELNLRSLAVRRQHGYLLLAWPFLSGLGWLLMRPFGPDAALAGMLIGATPTATAAPVITALLGGNAGFVAVSVLVSNILAAFAVPLLLQAVQGHAFLSLDWGKFYQSVSLVLIPLLLAQLVVKFFPQVLPALRKTKGLAFPLWTVALTLASAHTVAFLRLHADQPLPTYVGIAVGSACLCTLQFFIGQRLGGSRYPQEAAQSLGQKNTMLTLWMALTFCGPVVALGPAFYVLWHNLWNAWQLGKFRNRNRFQA